MLGCSEYLEEAIGQAAGLALIQQIFDACARLVEFPFSGYPRPAFERGLRVYLVDQLAIFYTVDDGIVTVRRILHQHQDAARIFGVEL